MIKDLQLPVNVMEEIVGKWDVGVLHVMEVAAQRTPRLLMGASALHANRVTTEK